MRHGGDRGAKGFTCWMQFVSMVFCHVARADSLWEICHGLAGCVGKLRHLGVMRTPRKSTLSYANGHRSSKIYEDLFWAVLQRLRSEWPGQRLPQVFHDPRGLHPDPKCRASLHAKVIIVDEKRSFVTSANFTEAAQVKNIEVGILLKDPLFAQQLAQHFQGLAEAGVLKPVML